MESDQKVCVITGASSGIGYAIAKKLKEKGHKIAVTARRKEKMKGLDPELLIEGDLNDFDIQEKVERSVFETFGKCDFLFNCAGIMEAGTIEEMDIEKMTRMIRLNIESTFRLTYMFLKQFKIQGYAHIPEF